MEDPRKTPNTNIVAAVLCRVTLRTPSPEKIAVNERIVTGFVIVKKNDDEYAAKTP